MVDKRLLTAKMALYGYNQRSLAQAVGISKNTMNLKINGKKPFDTEEIRNICHILHVNSGAEKAKIFLHDSSQNRDERGKERESK